MERELPRPGKLPDPGITRELNIAPDEAEGGEGLLSPTGIPVRFVRDPMEEIFGPQGLANARQILAEFAARSTEKLEIDE